MSSSAPSVAEQDAGHDHLVATMPMGKDCVVHKHRAWEPTESHHVWPLGMGGPNVEANRIEVCCNAHYAIHEFIRQLIIHAGAVPWPLAQHFSPKVRAYAIQGWTEAGKPTNGPSGE